MKQVKVYNDKNEFVTSYETAQDNDFIEVFEKPNRVEITELKINSTLLELVTKTTPKHISEPAESNNFVLVYDSPSLEQKLLLKLINIANAFSYFIIVRKVDTNMVVDFKKKQ